MIRFTEEDLGLLAEKGIGKEKVKKQIKIFEEGIPFVNLVKAAVVGDGILRFTVREQKGLINKFEETRKGLSLLKFVPASGAASRMFKALFNFLETYDPAKEKLEQYFERTHDSDLKVFRDGLRKFPFYETVMGRIKGKAANSDGELYLFVKEMMSEEALNYGFYPKGLLAFHNYGEYTATPFEEHLKEAADYAAVDGEAHLHFTISEQHIGMFTKEYGKINERLGKATNTVFHVTYSYQKNATDTIAVDMDNNPFRNSDGSLLFRPGGHGALIENLDDEDADIIFIKNIDNVVVPNAQEELTKSKKMLAGLLFKVQEKAFAYAKRIDDGNLMAIIISEIKEFLENELNVCFADNYPSFSIGEQTEILKDKINRPIRICGMVKNEGEPGGGPFWVKNLHDHVSLQIIESAQIDMSNTGQAQILKNATHFNPVDLVCGIKDHKGEKYNLLDYVDHKQGFITEKTKDGRPLKALELPGLWNGAMAYWNTIFVEVPLATFNPVKTVNDLLKPTHQVS
ncbi:MAG: NAD metabolism ATPase/kinase [Maribacter sp.]|nr:MAG: NAD metabolism ATPase/kinase [Maribacter sp.]